VYNWTDSPSIVSRDQFTILDPHLEWSGGGPRYNFVKDCDDPAMVNHMSAFSCIVKNPRQSFDGTVIRIPLRRKEQVCKSMISSKNPTVQEVQEVMQNFAEGFGKSGLLFMKNVESITIESTSGKTTQIRMANIEDTRK
jgi:sacsin